MNESFGRGLVKCLHNGGELLVGSFLSWLRRKKCAKLLNAGTQSTALLTVSLAANK